MALTPRKQERIVPHHFGVKTMKLRLWIIAFGTLIALSCTMCFGQPLRMAPADAVQQEEFGDLATGDGYIHIMNSGANGATHEAGTITVHVYAFSPDEQLISCCSCRITPDAVELLSVKQDLISNTLTPATPTSITVKLVASKGSGSNNTAATDQRVYGSPGFSSGLRATRLASHDPAGFPGVPAKFVTEAPFFIVPVSDGEYSRMVTLCKSIQDNGSGFGICRSCRLGSN